MNSLPIEHLSYSAMRTYLTNPWLFRKRYILGLYDFKASPAMYEGKAGHKYVELRLKGQSVQAALSHAMKMLESVSDDQIDWGKTGSREKSQKKIASICEFVESEMPDLGEILKVEYSAVVKPSKDGQEFPLPIKAVTDVVSKDDTGIALHDWKFTASYTDPDSEDPEKIMQAVFNYFTVCETIGEPHSMTFWEIKTTKNRDGSPQVRPYTINFQQDEYFRAFGRIYSGIVRQLSKDDHIFLPNLSDRLTSQESWEDFVSEVMEFDMPERVSHRTASDKMVEKRFVRQEVVEDTTSSVQDKIISKLMEFGMVLEFERKYEGATLDMYAFKTARGVRMSKIEKYEQDLQQALEVKSVRVLAPIPGSKFVGVEVPKGERKTVELPDSLGYRLPIGEDVYGHSHEIDLEKTPHILVAGSTGSGKSVCLSNFIHTLSNTDVKMILIDPKRSEFMQFATLPNLMAEIITENDEVEKALSWLIDLMESRYARLQETGCRDIREYQEQYDSMERVVVIIDELADLMLTVGKSKRVVANKSSNGVDLEVKPTIEEMLIRLAQKSRAAGIHLILATQRPSVDVVTGLLKSNITTRIAFMTASAIDSKVIIDQPGAQKLIGQGDCLLMQPGSELIRCQGYYKSQEI